MLSESESDDDDDAEEEKQSILVRTPETPIGRIHQNRRNKIRSAPIRRDQGPQRSAEGGGSHTATTSGHGHYHRMTPQDIIIAENEKKLRVREEMTADLYEELNTAYSALEKAKNERRALWIKLRERERAKEAQKNELKMAMDALRRETAAYERDLRELVNEDRDRRQFSLEHRGRPTISVY